MKRALKVIVFAVLIFLLLLELIIGSIRLLYYQKNYPFVRVLTFQVGGLSQEETVSLLTQKLISPQKIYLKVEGQLFDLDTQALSLDYDPIQTAFLAHTVGRGSSFLGNIKTMFQPTNVTPSFKLDQQALKLAVEKIESVLQISPRPAKAIISGGKLVIQNGTKGTKIDLNQLVTEIQTAFSNGSFQTLEIKTIPVDLRLNQTALTEFQKRGTSLFHKNLVLYADDVEVKISDQDLVSLLSPTGGLNEEALDELVQRVGSEINRPPQNPVFVIQGAKVVEFAPSRDGLEINPTKTASIITEIINKLESERLITFSSEVPVERTFSEYKTEDVNNLGIKEKIGQGDSDFKGSITSRVHNVSLAASKFNGVIVKPGETISFNQILGDVSALTGYQQAYIIKDGATILGDGGGVCQVSSTLFRAALKAGLPILERQAHAYRVYYYEQNSEPGLDATVYDPKPDLKIKNDTPGHILIQTKMDAKNYHLTFEIYGTNDGRKATVSKSILSDKLPPLPDIYVDDPTLPTGTVKQIDHQASGAKATFNYQVEKDGQVIYEKKFVSVYQPWANKFLRGTGPTN